MHIEFDLEVWQVALISVLLYLSAMIMCARLMFHYSVGEGAAPDDPSEWLQLFWITVFWPILFAILVVWFFVCKPVAFLVTAGSEPRKKD